MAKYYRSEDDEKELLVESPETPEIPGEGNASGNDGEPIPAVATPGPSEPPPPEIETIADINRAGDEPEESKFEEFFRMEGDENQAPVEEPVAPAEAPVAPAEAPVAPAEGEAPVVGVPAAEPMADPSAPQPETEVTTGAPAMPPAEDGAPAAPAADTAPAEANLAPVENPNEPVEEPVNNAPVARFRQEDGDAISVVETPEPTEPAKTETETCPETGDECVTKDVNEPINPVISQEDPITADDDSNIENVEAGGTEPITTGKTDNTTIIDPAEGGETEEDVLDEVTGGTMCFRQLFHMGDDSSPVPESDDDNIDTGNDEVSSDNGDQDVNVHVEVRKDDGDEHEIGENEGDTPVEQMFGFNQGPSADQMFQSFMQDGGDWL